MSSGLQWVVGPNKRLCSLMCSNECLGLIDITEMYWDGETSWDYCKPCAAHEAAH